MEGKIEVIIKRPDEKYGHVTNISPTLGNLQKHAGGRIEVVPVLPNRGLVMICNEEGKLLGLERNFAMGRPPFRDVIVGTVILCGTDGEEFADIPIDLDTWKYLLDGWNT